MSINSSYQRSLARSLVETLGIDDAVDVCRQNQWDGVLAEIDKTIGRLRPGENPHSTAGKFAAN